MIGKIAKWIGFIVVGFIVVGVIGVMIGGGNKKDDSAKVADSSTSSSTTVSSEAPIADKTFTVGELIESNGKQLKVTKVTRGYKPQYYQVKSGKELVKIDLELINNTESEMSYNTFDFKIQDSAGDIKDIDSTSYTTDNALSTGSLAKGGKKTGSIVFEVPQADAGLVMTYTSSFWGGDKVKIKI